ncbi:MAG: CinA family protein [Hyphomicrobium sp.]|nr:CinA family protein [Hyphomicrobium sp.]
MFAPELIASAEALLNACRSRNLKITAAESCTGGLVTGILTEIPGASEAFDRGFVTYSNAAKSEMLGVPAPVIARHGAVSAAVALAMVEGALKHAPADVAVAITGIAGPDGGTIQKPVGLVYIAAHRKGGDAVAHRFNFTSGTRYGIRMESVREALRLALEAVQQ